MTVKDKPTPEEIKTILEQDKKDRMKQAYDEIKVVLGKNRCVMDAVIVLTNGKVESRIDIIAND